MGNKTFKLARKFSSFLPLNSVSQFDSDMESLQEMVRKFSKDKVSPLAYKIDKEDYFPRKELWQEMGDLGLFGVTCPSQYGGSDLNFTAQCIIMEELSRASASIGLSYAAHSNLCINQIVRHGNEDQKRKYLPKLNS